MSYPGGYPSAPPAPSSWQPDQQTPPPQYGYYGHPPPQSAAASSSPYSHPPSTSPYTQPYSASGGGQHSGPGAPSLVGYPPPYGYAPQAYGAHVQSLFPPGTDPEIVRAFQASDRDGSGLVDEFELHKTLSVGQLFSLGTVRLMILLYSTKDSRKIGPKEFMALWRSLEDWKIIFQRFDRDRSGSIDKGEMREALLSLGYAISPPILDCLLQRHDQTGQAKAMDYDSFVECGLLVKGLTEKFKEQDTRLTGSATLSYQTFMLMVLPFIVA